MAYDILVNNTNPLDENYIPNNLLEYTLYSTPKLDKNHKIFIEKNCYLNYLRLSKDAMQDNCYLIVDSAYRSYDYQALVFDYNQEKFGIEYTFKYVALPGCSEHQTGLAIDFAIINNGHYIDYFNGSEKELLWLQENAYKYGFILRYPKECEDITGFNYEPWHYRFVGKEISTFMHDNNIKTLEEYHNLLNKKRR